MFPLKTCERTVVRRMPASGPRGVEGGEWKVGGRREKVRGETIVHIIYSFKQKIRVTKEQ